MVRTAFGFTSQMAMAGVSRAWTSRYAITCQEEIEAVGWFFERLRVTQRYGGFNDHRAAIGDRGVAVAYATGRQAPCSTL